ncbi:MAG: RimK family alpha-L-glutamate ligase [Candidatus Bathyarchaeota archaeon]|nr:RimK family alpha-L-glutamate ligase [Candidatus Bathyarchaeota archaeon A05DMB-3]MDH7606545.1 RimK family alpha-L-glutamate ligase [Candidatus Bathyarchaeota archaeon]
MKFGIVTRNPNAYSSAQLRKALERRGIPHVCFSFPWLVARVGYKPYLNVHSVDVLKDLNALIIRPIGRGSLEEIVFRMDLLYRLERLGFYVVNPPEAIEHCVDKYDLLAILEDAGIPVPRTAVTEDADEALKAFHELGGDVVVKPLFGSRGVGSTRLTDPEVAYTVFRAIAFYHGVIYLQEFVPHGCSDIRAFVIGDRVAAAMHRVATSWKTNYSQGAHPQPLKLDGELEELAVKSAKLIECKIAGVDILESPRGPLVIEVNSQPGWRGLQSVTRFNIADEIVNFVLSELEK